MNVDLLSDFLGLGEVPSAGEIASSLEKADDMWTVNWLEQRLEAQGDRLSQVSFDDLVRLAADLGWELRLSRSADYRRTSGFLTIDELEKFVSERAGVDSNSDKKSPSIQAGNKLAFLLLLESHQFDFRNRAFAALIDRFGGAFFSPEELSAPYFQALRIMTQLSSKVEGSAERAFANLKNLVEDHDLLCGQGDKTQHRVLKAAWHAIENDSLLPEAADLLLRQASRMRELGFIDSNVHFRSSRALMVQGDLVGADREIDEALRLATSEILTDQYFAAKQSIVAMKSLLALQSRELNVAVSQASDALDEVMKKKQRNMEENFESRFKTLDQRLNSAVVFNLQVLAILVSAIAVGGAAWGFGVRLIDASNWRAWDSGDKIEAFILWFVVVGVTTLIFGALLVIVHRFVVGHHSTHSESDFDPSGSKTKSSNGVGDE